MYWRKLGRAQRIAIVVIGVGALIGLVLAGGEGDEPDADEADDVAVDTADGDADDDDAQDDADRGAAPPETPSVVQASASRLSFEKWSHASGLFSTEVPRGWRIDGALGDATDQGQFRINAYSADGRSLFSLGHNWVSYMEFQYGPYQPGTATIERLILPGFLQEQGYVGSRITYRSANKRISMPSEIGVPIPFDSGTVGFLLQSRSGDYAAGTAFGETMYITSPGTPGLWRLRLFAAAVAPAEPGAQAGARAALGRAVERLELSPQFFDLWNRAFAHTQQQMREYSAQMDRVFSRYLRSAARSASRGGRDTGEDWATMMRGGQYAENEETGEHYWVSNERQQWWVNESGTVVGTDTGAPPAVNEDWKVLTLRGQTIGGR